MKYTPEKITTLEPHQIFVFGCNDKGIHGAGAAKQAVRFGAKRGVTGLSGQTYGIITRAVVDFHPFKLETCLIEYIADKLARFYLLAAKMPDKEFLMTKIGTGLAGYKINEIRALFDDLPRLNNIVLPIEFLT